MDGWELSLPGRGPEVEHGEAIVGLGCLERWDVVVARADLDDGDRLACVGLPAGTSSS